MKKFLQNITEILADAALNEMGIETETIGHRYEVAAETLEENFIEVAFAEAADYDDIHKMIQREHRREWEIAHPDDCRLGDSNLCFV